MRPADPAAAGLVLEGSALWPETVATLHMENVAAFWLSASDALFRARIHAASGYAVASERERLLVQRFLGRTIRYNQQMMDAVDQLGLASIDVEQAPTLDQLIDRCLLLLSQQGEE